MSSSSGPAGIVPVRNFSIVGWAISWICGALSVIG
jgi:hypothetical protein